MEDAEVKDYIDTLMSQYLAAFKSAKEERDKHEISLQDQLDRRFTVLQHQLDGRFAHEREHADLIVAALRELVDQRSTHQEEAVNKAETATEKRFDAVNEFREQLADQATSFMPREVAEARFEDSRKKLDDVSERVTTLSAEQVGAAQRQATILAVATFVIILAIAVANYLAAH